MSHRNGVTPVLEIDSAPDSRRTMIANLWRYRPVLLMLARTDFKARYKRAALGVVWAVILPLVQALIMAIVFSRVIDLGEFRHGYAVYVLSGVLAWSYFAVTISIGSAAIADEAELTEKIWFPRAILPIVPAISHVVGYVVSIGTMVIAMPLLGVTPGPRLALLIPASLLLFIFSSALALILGALHVYFRDVRYLVHASLLIWFYATPIIYPVDTVKGLRGLIDINPMTGILALFRLATVGEDRFMRPLLIAIVMTILLVTIAVEIYRRHDRLLADLL